MKKTFLLFLALFLSLALPLTAFAVDEHISFEEPEFSAGNSVEGDFGTVSDYLKIDYPYGDAKVIRENNSVPLAYNGNIATTNDTPNGCLQGDQGVGSNNRSFPDSINKWLFEFSEDVVVSSFSIRMTDYGDWFPVGSRPNPMTHAVKLVAYDADDNPIDTDDSLSFTSTGTGSTGRTSSEYGYLGSAGDACETAGGPGQYVFSISGADIAYVEVQFNDTQSIDPGIGFDDIEFSYVQRTITTDLCAGQDMVVGNVEIWRDLENLYAQYILPENSDWCITETHLHVEGLDGDFPLNKKGNPKVGHFVHSDTHDCVQETEVITIPLDTCDSENGIIGVAAHAVVISPIDDCYETVWQIGDVEVINAETGWLENYADEFNWEDPAGPITMGPGLTISSPAFTSPFMVGTTPTSEFPYNSNKVKNYATDFDVQWEGSLPFGGLLTVSWSPGQSANEIKIVGGDGVSDTFSATGTPQPGSGWFMDKYPLVEDQTTINPLANGTHNVNFQHTAGDGTFWDWIKLEKNCEQDESAWGGACSDAGQPFTDSTSNWSTYFEYDLGSSCVVE